MSISPSRLRSFLFWKKQVAKDPAKFCNITFPCSPEEWKRMTGDICPICQGFMHGPVADETEEDLYCICSTLDWVIRQRELDKEYEESVIPAKISDLIVYNIPSVESTERFKKLLAYLPTWIEYPKDWMLILGGPGTGKTHIMRSIKAVLPELSLYISSARLQQLGFNALTNGRMNDLYSVLSTVPILLLDDWGMEHTTSFSTDTMAAIIDRRYAHADEYVTVVTSNYSTGQLNESPNIAIRRIASRMMDAQKSHIFSLRQADFRLPMVQGAIL